MIPYKLSRIIFAVLFSVVLLSYAVYNAIIEFVPLKTALADFNPKSPSEIKGEIFDFESQINENMAWRYHFIEGYAYTNAILGSNTSEMDLGKGKDGGVYDITLYPDDQIISTQNYARRIRELKNNTAKTGAKVMYVQPPEKSIRGYTEAPYGMPFRNRSARMDALLYHLQSYGVDYIDLRQTLPAYGLPYDKWFYKTDHHWTSELAFVAFTDIVTYMDENYSANLDPDGFYRDINNYGSITYPNSFLGATGRTTGINFSALDDFTAMYPKFESRYHYHLTKTRITGEPIDRKGTALETIYVPAWLETYDAYKNSPYSYYADGIAPYAHIENLDNTDAPNILVIGDSYAMPLVTFLSPMFHEVEFVWPLAYKGSSEVERLLEENTYDYIIIESYPDNISDEMFEFFRSADRTEPISEVEDEQGN